MSTLTKQTFDQGGAYPVVQGEFVAMTLARRCGLSVAPVSLVETQRRYALLVERFRRVHLDAAAARAIVDAQIEVVRDAWDEVCDHGRLTAHLRATFLGRQFLDPSAFH